MVRAGAGEGAACRGKEGRCAGQGQGTGSVQGRGQAVGWLERQGSTVLGPAEPTGRARSGWSQPLRQCGAVWGSTARAHSSRAAQQAFTWGRTMPTSPIFATPSSARRKGRQAGIRQPAAAAGRAGAECALYVAPAPRRAAACSRCAARTQPKRGRRRQRTRQQDVGALQVAVAHGRAAGVQIVEPGIRARKGSG